jgi:hypothetical protein
MTSTRILLRGHYHEVMRQQPFFLLDYHHDVRSQQPSFLLGADLIKKAPRSVSASIGRNLSGLSKQKPMNMKHGCLNKHVGLVAGFLRCGRISI